MCFLLLSMTTMWSHRESSPRLIPMACHGIIRAWIWLTMLPLRLSGMGCAHRHISHASPTCYGHCDQFQEVICRLVPMLVLGFAKVALVWSGTPPDANVMSPIGWSNCWFVEKKTGYVCAQTYCSTRSIGWILSVYKNSFRLLPGIGITSSL